MEKVSSFARSLCHSWTSCFRCLQWFWLNLSLQPQARQQLSIWKFEWPHPHQLHELQFTGCRCCFVCPKTLKQQKYINFIQFVFNRYPLCFIKRNIGNRNSCLKKKCYKCVVCSVITNIVKLFGNRNSAVRPYNIYINEQQMKCHDKMSCFR